MNLSFLERHSFIFIVALTTNYCSAAVLSIDCKKQPERSIEAMLCRDTELMALDRVMEAVYTAALKKATNEHPPVLKPEQRGWIKGRNDCWKADDKRACVVTAYRRRIVELQAKYRLVTASTPIRYVCNGNPADEVHATYFQTDPLSLIAERGDQTSLMFQEPAASGTKYVGRNELLWEHQNNATIRWGYQAPEMPCVKQERQRPMQLVGENWQLRAIHSMDDQQGTTNIGEPDRYTLRFDNDGRVSFRLDCNRGLGTWQTEPSGPDSGTLSFGPVAMTRAHCPGASVDQKLTQQLPFVRSYVFKNGRLFMSLMADGGTMEWIRTESSQ